MLGAGALSMPLGIMSDRLGRKGLVLSGILISTLTSFLIAFSTTSVQMMIIYALAGVAIAAFSPTMLSFVADFTPPTHLGRSYGWYTMATYVAMGVGPTIGGFFAHLWNYQWVFVISGLLGILVFLVALPAFPRQRAAGRQSKRGSRKIIRELLQNRSLVACWIVSLFNNFGLGVFLSFLALHASEQGIGVGKIGLIFGTQAIVNALGRIPFGYLGDRVSHRSHLVVIGGAVYSLSMAGVAISSSLETFILSAFVMGIGMGIAFTAVGALIPELVSPDSRGCAMGGYTTAIYTGAMLAASIMGVVAGNFGFRVCFLGTAALLMIGALTFSLMFKSGLAANRMSVAG
jgi:MFS family permease